MSGVKTWKLVAIRGEMEWGEGKLGWCFVPITREISGRDHPEEVFGGLKAQHCRRNQGFL